MSTKAQHDDPRDASLEVKEVLPHIWRRETSDASGSLGMFLSGLIVMTRNRSLAWGALIYALNTLLNGHPLRNKEAANNLTTLVLCLCATFACYFPHFVVTKNPVLV